MAIPTLPLDGGCRCGALRFRINAPPMLTGACHCTGCQRMTGSAFSLTVTVPGEGFTVTKGEPVIGGLHGEVRHHHCPHCLSWVFTRPPEGPMTFVNVRATMLDDPGWFVPFVESYTSEMLPWAATPATHRYAEFPPMEDYPALIAEYQNRPDPGKACPPERRETMDNQGPTSGLTPHIAIADKRASEAIDFYKKAFGATELTRIPADDGVRLMHAHLTINGASLMMHDEFPEYVSEPSGKPDGVTLHLQVDDADAWFQRAVDAGASVVMPLDDMFWGDRYGQVKDPFGHQWSIGTPIKGDTK